jgi:hypothetical protein
MFKLFVMAGNALLRPIVPVTANVIVSAELTFVRQ